jgi:hypothetical protein
VFIKENSVESSFETPAYQDMGFRAEELNLIGSSEMAVAE